MSVRRKSNSSKPWLRVPLAREADVEWALKASRLRWRRRMPWPPLLIAATVFSIVVARRALYDKRILHGHDPRIRGGDRCE